MFVGFPPLRRSTALRASSTGRMMKASCTLIASVVAASSLALSSSASGAPTISSNPTAYMVKSMNSEAASLDKGRFAPKFDGLRFIETLITAHR